MNAARSGAVPAVAALEQLAFEAWPAEEVVWQEGWGLRHTPGGGRRANAVATHRGAGRTPLVLRIERVEEFYARRGRSAVFQLTPAALPEGLDEALEGRGYERSLDGVTCAAEAARVALAVSLGARARAPRTEALAEVADRRARGKGALQLADANRAASVAPGEGEEEVSALRLFIEPAPFAAWLTLAAGRGESEGRASYRALVERLEGQALFALVERRGEPAAVGLGITVDRWLAIFSLITRPAHRRRGCARRLLAGLAEAARRRGVDRLFLQVEADNQAARALYAGVGFEERYRFYERIAPSEP